MSEARADQVVAELEGCNRRPCTPSHGAVALSQNTGWQQHLAEMSDDVAQQKFEEFARNTGILPRR
jgi:hypothetical protein